MDICHVEILLVLYDPLAPLGNGWLLLELKRLIEHVLLHEAELLCKPSLLMGLLIS